MATRSESLRQLGGAVRSIELTRRGRGFLAASVAVFVAGRVFDLPTLDRVFSLLLGLLVCAALYLLLGRAHVQVDRVFKPDVIEPGHTAVASVTVTNVSALPSLELTWDERLPAGVVGVAQGVMAGLGSGRGPRARTTVHYQLHGVRRGRHRIGPLTVTVADPFGLVERQHEFVESHDLIVLPKRVDLAPISFGGTPTGGATRPAPQHVGIGDDDVIARSYLPGDAMRRMHWKATAHRGALMVRQEEQRNNPEATVLLDTDAMGHATMRDGRGGWTESATFEWAVTAAASIAAHLTQRRYAVHVLTPGGPLNRAVGDGLDPLAELMVDLAVVAPANVSPATIAAVPPSERPVVAVLANPDEAQARAWAGLNRSTGLAFVSAAASADVLDILAAAGWKCRTYRSGDALAPLWLDLDARQFHAAR